MSDIGQVDNDDDEEDPRDVVSELVPLLEEVAKISQLTGYNANAWVEAVLYKLNQVGVESIQDLIKNALNLNRMLSRNGHPRMHQTTIVSLLTEA